jgi:hypothetical protein
MTCWFYQGASFKEKKVGDDEKIRNDSDVHHSTVNADGLN